MKSDKSFDPAGLLKKFAGTIDSQNLLHDGETVLIGVSGGPDSMCLLDLFQKLSITRGYRIEAAHVNHMIRGEDAEADRDFVAGYCREHKIVFHTRTCDVPQLAKEQGTGLEETARTVRYQYFEELTGERGIKIAVAHHRRDQIETILLNLIRGSGIDGLAGMDYCTGRVIRPMLDFTKDEIDRYLAFYSIPFCVDQTNSELCADRNRIRLKLLPIFQKYFNRDIENSILKTSRLCRQDAACLEKIARDAYNANLVRIILPGNTEEAVPLIPCDYIKTLDPAISSRVVRCLYEEVKGDRLHFSLIQTEAVLKLAQKGKDGSETDLSGGLCARVENGNLRVLRKKERDLDKRIQYGLREIRKSVEVSLEIPSERYVEEINSTISTKFVEKPEDLVYNAMSWCFPFPRVRNAVWRYRREGDWIRPNTGSGTKTLKKFLTDRKIPADEKDRIFFLADGQEVLWIPGMAGTTAKMPAVSIRNQNGSNSGTETESIMDTVCIQVRVRS